jgi:hypothetical protein
MRKAATANVWGALDSDSDSDSDGGGRPKHDPAVVAEKKRIAAEQRRIKADQRRRGLLHARVAGF